MPYIKPENRSEMDKVVDKMEEVGVKANGDLNYILYKYCLNNIKPSYNNYKNYCGELRQCVTEIERRVLAKYEDKKIEENGDVEYKTKKIYFVEGFDSQEFDSQENGTFSAHHVIGMEIEARTKEEAIEKAKGRATRDWWTIHKIIDK